MLGRGQVQVPPLIYNSQPIYTYIFKYAGGQAQVPSLASPNIQFIAQ